MSRSYKKHAYGGDPKGQWKKRIANRKVRAWLKNHPNEILHFNDYKRVVESYDICDFGGLWSWNEEWECELKHYNNYLNGIESIFYNYKRNNPPDKKEVYRQWYKTYKGK